MTTTIPRQPPSRAWHPTWHDLNSVMLTDDSMHWALERRVIALEEALVSRRARRRLRREIRAGARVYAWAGSFEAGRAEATMYEWLIRPGLRVPDIAPIPDDPADGDR